MIRTPFTWDKANFSWESNPFGSQQSANPFTWDDVALVEEVAQAIAGGISPQEALKDKKKKKRFIKLICQVQGIEYVETKEVIDRKITLSEIQMVIKEVFNSIKIEL